MNRNLLVMIVGAAVVSVLGFGTEGSVLTVPSFVEHGATATEDTTFVSFFSGVRKDLLGTNVPEHFKAEMPDDRAAS